MIDLLCNGDPYIVYLVRCATLFKRLKVKDHLSAFCFCMLLYIVAPYIAPS